MATYNAPEALRTHLVSAYGQATAANTFACPPTVDDDRFPATAIFLWSTGGMPMIPIIGKNEDVHLPLITARIRAVTYSDAIAIGRGVRDNLHRAAIAGFTTILCDRGDPTYLGMDSAKRHQVQMNFAVRYRE